MKNEQNKGFQQPTIDEYKAKMSAKGSSYLLDESDEQTDEYAHFYFIGVHEGREVIYDAALYTLRLHHESELYEAAEKKAAKHFPTYKKVVYGEENTGDETNPMEEEIGLFLAEVIMELEEEETIKVKEHVDQDIHADFGVSLDVGLHVDTVTPSIIARFVQDFNADNLSLDETLYSFQTSDQDGE
ncbi:MAG TPA: hypothetical protein VK666_03890 [Chryseolinea sp.]|nr:hypothetical protein [Chryseolinea sp.]